MPSTPYVDVKNVDVEKVELEKGLENVLVRCPECLKLYSSQAQKLKPPRPHFYCPQCQHSFWLFYDALLQNPYGLVGYKLTSQKVRDYKGLHALNPQPFCCPKCRKAYKGGQKQCHSCGVVFAKFQLSGFDFLDISTRPRPPLRPVEHASFETPADIKHLWQHVLHHYTDPRAHRAIMQLCLEFGHFAYLAERYKTFLQLSPGDKMARQGLNQLKFLAQQYFSPSRHPAWEPLLPWPQLLSPPTRGVLLFLAAVISSWGAVLGLLPLFALGLLALVLTWLV